MKEFHSGTTSQPPLSKYAQKQLRRRAEQAKELSVLEANLASTPPELPRERRVTAVVQDFNPRTYYFTFAMTSDGDLVYLSKYTVLKSGFKITPGCTIVCDTEPDPKGRCPRVAYIRSVAPPSKW